MYVVSSEHAATTSASVNDDQINTSPFSFAVNARSSVSRNVFKVALASRSFAASDATQRAATMQYMHGWNIFAKSGAHILGVRAPDGELQAAVVCWKSPGGAKGVGTSVCGALSYIGKYFDGTHNPLPMYMKSRKLIDKRLNALIKAQKSMKQ